MSFNHFISLEKQNTKQRLMAIDLLIVFVTAIAMWPKLTKKGIPATKGKKSSAPKPQAKRREVPS